MSNTVLDKNSENQVVQDSIRGPNGEVASIVTGETQAAAEAGLTAKLASLPKELNQPVYLVYALGQRRSLLKISTSADGLPNVLFHNIGRGFRILEGEDKIVSGFLKSRGVADNKYGEYFFDTYHLLNKNHPIRTQDNRLRGIFGPDPVEYAFFMVNKLGSVENARVIYRNETGSEAKGRSALSQYGVFSTESSGRDQVQVGPVTKKVP